MRKVWVIILTILITIVLLTLLFTQVQLVDLITTIENINPVFLLIGFILYTCSYIFRAWRFHLLLNKEVSIKDLFNIGCVHNMMNSLLPVRTGELSYIYLLKKVNSRTTGEGIASLLVARIFDFIAITLLFFISFLFAQELLTELVQIIWILLIFLLCMVFLLLMVIYAKEPVRLLKIILKITWLEKFSFSNYIMKIFEESNKSIEKIHTKNLFIQVLLLSLTVWFLNDLIVFFLLKGMDINLPLQIVVLGATFSLLSMIIPIQGIAGFGTQEGFWVFAFAPLGLPLDKAISTGFVFHIVIIMYFLILGAVGIFSLRSKIFN
jgi:glycosyltransferase 2 family protein